MHDFICQWHHVAISTLKKYATYEYIAKQWILKIQDKNLPIAPPSLEYIVHHVKVLEFFWIWAFMDSNWNPESSDWNVTKN